MENEKIQDDFDLFKQCENMEIQDYSEPSSNQYFVNDDSSSNGYDTEAATHKPIKKIGIAPEKLAKKIVVGMDIVLPTGIGLIFEKFNRKPNEDDLELDDEEKDILIENWTDYLREKQVDVSPGLLLIISILLIYSMKIAIVLKSTAKDKEIAELKKQAEDSKKEAEKYKAVSESIGKEYVKYREEKEKLNATLPAVPPPTPSPEPTLPTVPPTTPTAPSSPPLTEPTLPTPSLETAQIEAEIAEISYAEIAENETDYDDVEDEVTEIIAEIRNKSKPPPHSHLSKNQKSKKKKKRK
jgi:hypothetical protein